MISFLGQLINLLFQLGYLLLKALIKLSLRFVAFGLGVIRFSNRSLLRCNRWTHISILLLQLSDAVMIVCLCLLQLIFKFIDLFCLVRISCPLLVNLTHALLFLSQTADSSLEILIAIFKLSLQLLNPIFELFLSAVVVVRFLCFCCSLNKHWDAVGVSSLDGLFQELAFLFKLAVFFSIFFRLLFETLQVVKFTALKSDLLLLFTEDLLVITEPGNFFL